MAILKKKKKYKKKKNRKKKEETKEEIKHSDTQKLLQLFTTNPNVTLKNMLITTYNYLLQLLISCEWFDENLGRDRLTKVGTPLELHEHSAG